MNDVLHPENCGIVEKSLSDEKNRKPVGTIQSVTRDYYIKMAEEDEKAYHLFLQLKDGETLSTNEKIWLETIIRYVSILYDNLHLMNGY
ncbi:hypothetical protein RCG24_04470 [Neobacillus sp. OS1-32]|uniref:Uncharacterized protein n=1 Tax=Neobacillus paridis TaxID=2803862 RepID=A0ABS1THS2_9BACI|nr:MULTISPECIES: hypothetical protein [Neobacillus]MBL4950874.1 hypothetical protein [Neobacillus paridis]WML31142.1 hypothetical protein RCG24_04470 [Neobacillus sp. OS1-32]